MLRRIIATALIVLIVSPLRPSMAQSLSEPIQRCSDAGSEAQASGKYAEAAKQYQKALALSELSYGEESANSASILIDLGLAYHSQGDYLKSERCFARSLAIRQKLPASDDKIAQALNDLGRSYRHQGRYCEAEDCWKKAIEKYRDPVSRAAVFSNLSILYMEHSRDTEAIDLGKRAFDTLLHSPEYGPDSPDTLTAENNLGGSYADAGQFTNAEPILIDCLKRTERIEGADSMSTAISLANLGELMLAEGKLDEAEKYNRQSLQIMQKLFDRDHPHPHMAVVLEDLGQIYSKRGKFEESEKHLQEAIAIWEQTAKGFTNPLAATAYIYLAEVYQVTNRYADAESLLKKTYAIAQGQVHVKPVQSTAMARASQFADLLLADQRELIEAARSSEQTKVDAQQSWSQATQAYKQILEKFSPENTQSLQYADCLEVSVLCQIHAMSESKIVPDLQKAIAIKQKILGQTSFDSAEAELQLGLYIHGLGGNGQPLVTSAYDSAVKMLLNLPSSSAGTTGDGKQDSAIKQSLQPADCQRLSDLFMCLSYALTDFDEGASARLCATGALKTARASSGGTVSWKVQRLLDISAFEQLTGEYALARAQADEAMQMARSGTDKQLLFTCTLALAKISADQSDYDGAAELATQALQLRTQDTSSSNTVQCYELLCQASAATGKIQEALDYANQALAVIGSQSDQSLLQRLTIETFVGRLLAQQEKWHDSEQTLSQTIDKVQLLCDAAGEAASADAALKESAADASSHVSFAEYRLQLGTTNLALADVYAAQDKVDQAHRCYARAIDVFQGRNDRSLIVRYIHALSRDALCQVKIGEAVAARTQILSGAEQMDAYIQQVFPQLSFGEQCAFISVLNEESDVLLSICHNESNLPQAYKYVMKWKGLLIESLRKSSAIKAAANSTPNVKQLVNQWSSKRIQLSGMSQNPNSDQALLRDLNREVEALEQSISRESILAVTDPLAHVTSQSFLHMLQNDQAFVDIVTYKPSLNSPESLGAVVLTAQSKPIFVELTDEQTFAQMVAQWRLNTARTSAARDVKIAGNSEEANHPLLADTTAAIKKAFWDKISAALLPQIKKVWLCPDAQSALVPWSAIAGDDRFICAVDSPRALAALITTKAATVLNPSVLLAGNIDYNDPQRRVNNLLGTGAEVEEIGRLAISKKLPVTQRAGQAATKEQIAEDILKADYVHLATHGFARLQSNAETRANSTHIALERGSDVHGSPFSARNPLVDSGLFFAYPMNRSGLGQLAGAEPGILTAEEIVGIDLKNCQLVTLSACQTGLGKGYSGQGLVGMRSALAGAGARSTLMSLWSVPDAATRKLMVEFYRNLWDGGKSKAAALRLAQESVRNDKTHSDWKLPYYWAAWVLAGEGW